MIHFILLLILCIIGGVCLPVLRRTLHPVEILVCWILTATLEQFDHAVLIVNLGVVEISGKIPDFFTLKLEQLAATSLTVLYGLGVYMAGTVSFPVNSLP
ncbi:hypothetical protein LJK87_42010 [Paenibacillus sp. P25]|nr:hypothetical protein LJK87_42010 [Paenibacillus sp. P25]